jgi:glycosyltransferase involved in cell wall biosynthesis
VTFEIIVIDDGSRDKTVSLLQDRPELYSELIVLLVNGGKGAAVKAGLGAASGDYILFQDADLEYDPEDYEKLMLPVLKFGADLVLGSRFVAPQYTRVSYFWHKIGNKLVTFLFNLLNNTTFTDIYSCYLMYRRSLLAPEQLITTGWEQHAEILSRVFTSAKSVYEVPISYRGRTYEEGKKIMAHHVISVTWTIVVRRFFR